MLGASIVSKRKLKSKSDDDEEAIKNGVEYEPIDYEWMFKVLKSGYQEPVAQPIIRIVKQSRRR